MNFTEAIKEAFINDADVLKTQQVTD